MADMKDRDLKPGEIVWQYQIEKLLGKGAFGDVYLAHHIKMHKRIVAMKRLRKSSANDVIIQRFIHEAFAMGEMYHPNVLLIFELIDPEQYPSVDSYYIIMEYLDGGTLRDWINNHEASQTNLVESIRIIKDILRGLAIAHQEKIIHRDIKPENILLSSDSIHVKIGDWGLAHLEDFRMTRVGSVIGTFAYMAPEQAVGASASVDPRSDLYSVGVMLYEMITGNVCLDFQAIGKNAVELWNRQHPMEQISPIYHERLIMDAWLDAIGHSKRIDPRLYLPDITTQLREILVKSVDIEPYRRFQSAEEFIVALDNFLQLQQPSPGKVPTKSSSHDEKISAVASLLVQARKQRQDHAYGKAIELLQQGQNTMPNDPGVCLELARIYNLIGCKDKAIVILEAAARHNPHNHVVLRDLGIAYLSTDRNKALGNLQESLRLNPNQNKVKELIRLLER